MNSFSFLAEDRLKVSSNNADPFELTLSVEPSAHFSPRQSARENTPASLSEHVLQMQTWTMLSYVLDGF